MRFCGAWLKIGQWYAFRWHDVIIEFSPESMQKDQPMTVFDFCFVPHRNMSDNYLEISMTSQKAICWMKIFYLILTHIYITGEIMLQGRYGKYVSITMTSHERHGVLNHRQVDSLFNNLLRLITQGRSNLHIAGPLWWETTSTNDRSIGFGDYTDLLWWK